MLRRAAAALQSSRQLPSLPQAFVAAARQLSTQAPKSKQDELHWRLLRERGHQVNPCNSKLHPSVVNAGFLPESEEELSLQEAYTPYSQCFGCGPACSDGLGLKSFRAANGLVARVTLAKRFQCFPGIIQGGVVCSLFECHGNWTSAVALMDASCLPKPPLTVTYELKVSHKEPVPPEEPLVVRSRILGLTHSEVVGNHKSAVRVELELTREGQDDGKVLAKGTGIFKKLGGVRAL